MQHFNTKSGVTLVKLLHMQKDGDLRSQPECIIFIAAQFVEC